MPISFGAKENSILVCSAKSCKIGEECAFYYMSGSEVHQNNDLELVNTGHAVPACFGKGGLVSDTLIKKFFETNQKIK